MSDLDNENEMKSKSPSNKRPKLLQKYKRESDIPISIAAAAASLKINKVNIETQTEWSWLQDMQLLEKLRNKEKFDFDHIIDDESKLKSLNLDAEESDTEHYGYETENEENSQPDSPDLLSPKPEQTVDSVGPPKILKYLPETKQVEIPTAAVLPPTSPTISIPYEPIEDLGQFMKDFNVHLSGGQPCEFCNEETKPWPSINDQETMNPELLYCCNEYQEYVDGLIQYQKEKEKIQNTEQDFRDLLNVNNKKAKQLAKERDEFRNMQKLLEKQKRLELITTLKQQQTEKTSEKATEKASIEKASDNKSNQKSTNTQVKKQVFVHHDKHHDLANQMKSINYQLSNLRYIQEGWTVRQNSDIGFEDYDDDPNFLTTYRMSDMDTSSQKEKPLIIKKYKNGNNCLILFSDGSGSCFYPSGRLALSLVLVSPGMHLISAFSDEQLPIQIASFDPFGNGSCNFPNGKIRTIISPFGGLELDSDGTKKKRWQWWDPAEHVHAPPFQSLLFPLNNQISVRIHSQEKINIDFLAENQICKFKVGSKMKLNRPESIMPAVIKLDINENYLNKKKNRIEQLFKLLSQTEGSTVLKLPKLSNSFTSSKTKITDFSKITAEAFKKQNSQRKQSSKFLTVP